MGVLGQALEALKSVVFLQEEVKRLGNNVARITDRLDEMRTSTARIEAQQQTAITIAQQAAQLSVGSELGGIKDRLNKIELYLAMREGTSRESIVLQSKSHSQIGRASDNSDDGRS
jgi:predicted  nucleic acid-binding Zn-ribbon protein